MRAGKDSEREVEGGVRSWGRLRGLSVALMPQEKIFLGDSKIISWNCGDAKRISYPIIWLVCERAAFKRLCLQCIYKYRRMHIAHDGTFSDNVMTSSPFHCTVDSVDSTPCHDHHKNLQIQLFYKNQWDEKGGITRRPLISSRRSARMPGIYILSINILCLPCNQLLYCFKLSKLITWIRLHIDFLFGFREILLLHFMKMRKGFLGSWFYSQGRMGSMFMVALPAVKKQEWQFHNISETASAAF